MTPHLSAPTKFAVGHVALTVNNLEKVAQFYQKTIGLDVLTHDGETLQLGAGNAVLLELRQDKQARQRSSREAGLFHTAFLLPSRSALASWVQQAIEQQLPVAGASDHEVSEAVYLSDPEGNGVEIYADRPASSWVWQNGVVQMGTAPLDIPALLEHAHATRWHGAPEGTRVGHVHLQVGALEPAENFYARTLGLSVTCRYAGGTFYAADGYHHHIATNVWNSRGAGPRAFPSTGLAEVVLSGTGGLPQSVMPVLGHNASKTEVTLQDPWGTPITVRTHGAV